MITHVATTEATVPDSQMTSVIDDDLARKNLLPRRHYLDSGYLSAALVAADHARHGIALIGPLLADTSAQARAGNARGGEPTDLLAGSCLLTAGTVTSSSSRACR
jgi:hypothetical protein